MRSLSTAGGNKFEWTLDLLDGYRYQARRGFDGAGEKPLNGASHLSGSLCLGFGFPERLFGYYIYLSNIKLYFYLFLLTPLCPCFFFNVCHPVLCDGNQATKGKIVEPRCDHLFNCSIKRNFFLFREMDGCGCC